MSQIRRAWAVGLLVLGIALTVPGTTTAGLINGDFSDGFEGWLGEVTDLGFNVTSLEPPPGTFTDNYDASMGEAVLTTTTLANEIWSVILFQTFIVTPPAPGQSLILSYDLSFSIPGGASGAVPLAQLTSSSGTISLLGMSSLDITSLAGQSVELLFGIEDLDDDEDQMILDNVQISGVDVPSPGTLSLLWLGASILLVAKRSRRSD